MFQIPFADAANTASNKKTSLLVVWFMLSNDSMGCQSNGMSIQYRGSQFGIYWGETNETELETGQHLREWHVIWYGGRILGGRTIERKMSWTPTPSHLVKQMSRKRGPHQMDWWNFLPRLRKVNVILGYFPGVSFCFSDMWKSMIWLLQGRGTFYNHGNLKWKP